MLLVNDNLLTGDVPDLPPSTTVNYTDNCLASCAFTRQASCPCANATSAEVAALVDLFVSTSGPMWRRTDGWNDNDSSDPVRGSVHRW